jgi:hypothetical protein
MSYQGSAGIDRTTFSRAYRQGDFDPESTFWTVQGTDASTVRLDRPAGDGQPQTEARGLPVRRSSDKGLEDRLQLPIGDTRSPVRDGDDSTLGIGELPERDLDRRALRGKLDGIATDILEGAVQYLCATGDDRLVSAGEQHPATGRLRFEPRILGDLAHQVRQVDRLVRLPTHADFQPRKGQELPDQPIEPDRLLLDPVQ